jgi:hypothetical protein
MFKNAHTSTNVLGMDLPPISIFGYVDRDIVGFITNIRIRIFYTMF